MAGSSRDDFSEATKRTLVGRMANRCSNPDCRSSTSGPQADPWKAVNLGVAAHITAASPGGPRYDSCMTPDQRMAPDNGIWLCQNCAKLVDNDPIRYTADVLRGWKASAESEALALVGKAVSTNPFPDQVVDKWVSLDYIEKAGIAQKLRDEGYKLGWVSANSDSKHAEERWKEEEAAATRRRTEAEQQQTSFSYITCPKCNEENPWQSRSQSSRRLITRISVGGGPPD